MNAFVRLLGLDRKVIVYTSSNGMISKAICRERDVAQHIFDVMKISENVNVRIEPFIT
jgi:hypothetical protein